MNKDDPQFGQKERFIAAPLAVLSSRKFLIISFPCVIFNCWWGHWSFSLFKREYFTHICSEERVCHKSSASCLFAIDAVADKVCEGISCDFVFNCAAETGSVVRWGHAEWELEWVIENWSWTWGYGQTGYHFPVAMYLFLSASCVLVASWIFNLAVQDHSTCTMAAPGGNTRLHTRHCINSLENPEGKRRHDTFTLRILLSLVPRMVPFVPALY